VASQHTSGEAGSAAVVTLTVMGYGAIRLPGSRLGENPNQVPRHDVRWLETEWREGPASEARRPAWTRRARARHAGVRGAIVCAGQRPDPEGSSPSAARMRGGVSKDGGNASSAGERNHGEPYAGTKSETTDTAKGMHLPSRSVRKDNRRAGCPPRGGIRKACGKVPGRNRGEPSP